MVVHSLLTNRRIQQPKELTHLGRGTSVVQNRVAQHFDASFLKSSYAPAVKQEKHFNVQSSISPVL